MVYVSQVIGGFCLGYILASFIESYLHEYVSDAPQSRVQRWQRYPRLLAPLLNTWFSHHIVHHFMTFRRDFVTQFESEEERKRLQGILSKRGRHGEIIIGGDYANHLHAEGAFVFCFPVIVVGVLASFLLPIVVVIGMLPALCLPPMFSYFVHPYLHMPHSLARERAPRWLRLLIGTRYMRAMRRNHFLHHEYGGTSNYNLVLGADLLRGRVRKATPADEARMRSLGIW
jgi:hypothetical protein